MTEFRSALLRPTADSSEFLIPAGKVCSFFAATFEQRNEASRLRVYHSSSGLVLHRDEANREG